MTQPTGEHFNSAGHQGVSDMDLKIIEKVFSKSEAVRRERESLYIKKISESQTKAGNQRKFENLEKFENLKKFENFLNFEILKFKIAQVDPRDILNNFCFHVYIV